MVDASQLISRNVEGAKLSAIKEMAMRSAKVEGAVSLAWGLPSFSTPEHIRRAAADALAGDPDVGKYTLPNGMAALRECVAQHHAKMTDVEVDSEKNVFITAGNMQGMNSLLHCILEPGDEVILTDPGFASHVQQIRMFGGVSVPWPLDEDAGWQLDSQALSGLITQRTKAIILVTPSNPTGAVFPKEDLVALAEFAKKHSLLVLLDDPYSDLVYDRAHEFFNLAMDRSLFDQMAYLFTFSKSHAMSGWRLGYMIVPDWLRQQVLKVHDATLICSPHISQVAGMAALSGGREHIEQFRNILAARRRLICERLDRVPHIFEYVKPEGAYYVLPRIVADHDNSFEFSLRLLDEARVSVTPGSAFGPSGEHHVRLAFCVDDDDINMAFDRLEAWLPG